MRNTLSCLRGQVDKEEDYRSRGSNRHEYQQQKGKGKSEITGGRLGGSEQEGRVSGEMQKN